MSSLLQFNGKIDKKKGVGLLAYKVEKGPEWDKYNGPLSNNPSPTSTTFAQPSEVFTATRPSDGAQVRLEILYEFFRKPRGMCGHWVVFMYNGEEHVPDLSHPMGLFKIPRDARRLSEEESAERWFS